MGEAVDPKFATAVKALVSIHGTRGTARLLGMPTATVSRIANDKPLDLRTAKSLYDKIGVCACCGHVKRPEALSRSKSDE